MKLFITTIIAVVFAMQAKAQDVNQTHSTGGFVLVRAYNGAPTSNGRKANPKNKTHTRSIDNKTQLDSSVSFGVYPNPAQDILTINCKEFTTSSYTYNVVANNGIIVLQGKLNQGYAQLSVQQLPVATYTIHVMQNDITLKSYQFVKN
jgi:hypothetical protein